VGKAMVKIWSLPEASSICVCQIEGTGIPSGGSQPASCCIIRSVSVVVTFRFGTIDWVLGRGESSKIGGRLSETEGRLFETGGDETSKIGEGLSEIEGRLFKTGGDETSEADEEKSSGSGDYCLGSSRISLIVVIEEETSSSAGRDCI
jgi:hypothetical protein